MSALLAWPLGIAAGLGATALFVLAVNAVGLPTQTGCLDLAGGLVDGSRDGLWRHCRTSAPTAAGLWAPLMGGLLGCRVAMAARTGTLNGGVTRNGNLMVLSLFGGLTLAVGVSGLLWLLLDPAPGGATSAFYILEFGLVAGVTGLVVLYGYRRGVTWSVD